MVDQSGPHPLESIFPTQGLPVRGKDYDAAGMFQGGGGKYPEAGQLERSVELPRDTETLGYHDASAKLDPGARQVVLSRMFDC
jgi:hypothetical protein